MSLVLIVLQLWPESVGVPDALAGEQGLGVVAWGERWLPSGARPECISHPSWPIPTMK